MNAYFILHYWQKVKMFLTVSSKQEQHPNLGLLYSHYYNDYVKVSNLPFAKSLMYWQQYRLSSTSLMPFVFNSFQLLFFQSLWSPGFDREIATWWRSHWKLLRCRRRHCDRATENCRRRRTSCWLHSGPGKNIWFLNFCLHSFLGHNYLIEKSIISF